MKEQFVDFETAKMLKELGFNEACEYMYDGFILIRSEKLPARYETNFNSELSKHRFAKYISAPLWQQVEQWLWEEHNIILEIDEVDNGRIFCSVSKLGENYLFETEANDSPITAKTEGIKAAVKHLHSQLSKEK